MTTIEDRAELKEPEPIVKLSRDLKRSVALLTPAQVRYLVDYYYQIQRDRIRSGNQVFSMPSEPHEVIRWLSDNTSLLERQIKSALDAYSFSQPVGKWSRTITGIGPVIAAGLLAHIDITKAPTVGHIWRFAGLDPTQTWERKTKRPWNARLKTLCWKIGESFWKVQNNENDVYGKLAVQRKEYEQARNDRGDNKLKSAEILGSKRFGKDSEAYKELIQGRLPKAQIHERSKRWAVKLFLAHWHHVAYENQYGIPPPKPYVLSILGHANEIKVPNWPMSI